MEVRTLWRHTDADAAEFIVTNGQGCPIVNVYEADAEAGTVTVAIMGSDTLLAIDENGSCVPCTYRPLGGVLIERREEAT